MADTTSLALLPELQHGFAVRARRHHESEILDIASVELEERTHDAVIVEGQKR